MGSRYLTDLASVVRGAGITVQEEPGWQTRSRSSGGYDGGYPNHVMVHHTASNASSDGQSDVNYMVSGSENAPVANLYLSRSGKVWVMAAGATNTNGSGTCPHCGTTDNMNSRAIGIECANNGVGEPYPTVQQDVYVKLVSTLCGHYGIANAAVIAHFEYAPSRKIDPAGQSRYATGSNKWNMPAFRTDCAKGGGEPTPPPSERPKLMYVLLQDDAGTCWATNMIEVRYLYSTDAINTFKSMLTVFGYGTTPTKCTRASIGGGCYGVIKGPLPGNANLEQFNGTYSDGWGATLEAGGGQPGGRADLILQEIRANVKG